MTNKLQPVPYYLYINNYSKDTNYQIIISIKHIILQDYYYMYSTHLVLFEVSPHSPSLVIGQCMPILLEECINTRDTPVPGILQILQC